MLCWDPAHAVPSHFNNLNDLAGTSAPGIVSSRRALGLRWDGERWVWRAVAGQTRLRADTASFRPQRLNKFHGRVSPRAVSAHGQVSRWLVSGEELTAAAFPALPQGRAAWALALWDTALVPSGPFRCDRPMGSTGTGSNHGIGGLRGTGPRCWANRGLCLAGMEGMGTWLRSGPFPSWGCFSPFSRCCRHKGHLVSAHLTCTHPWEFPQHP